MDVDTIVAIATPPGRGGVGIVRLSGPLSHLIGCQLTHARSLTPRTTHYRSFLDGHGELIDQGILLYFKAPFSFTGDDVVELQGHGAPVVLDRLLQECVRLGARLAKPGEYSERAFMNDKIDLTQAEAIADLIHASSLTAARMAMRSLQGDFSKKINQLSESLVQLRLFVEAAIDFHCFPSMLKRVQERIPFISEETIKKAIWNFDSNINQRIIRVYDEKEEEQWKSWIQPACAGYRAYIKTMINS